MPDDVVIVPWGGEACRIPWKPTTLSLELIGVVLPYKTQHR
jgi:hypothetical protein